MSKSNDWMPTNRTDQLTMAKNWVSILKNPVPIAADSEAGDKPTRTIASTWNVPDETVQSLQSLVNNANSALGTAKNEETRTPVTTTLCRTAFEDMIALMRDTKKRYFYIPPLHESDLVALGLKIPDSSQSSSGYPTAQVAVETYLIGRHQLGVKISYITGSPSEAANKSFRIWYSVIAPGETPPQSPDQLHESFFTKRKKDVLEFQYNDSGKIAYIAVRIENDAKKGPWGPMIQALIP